MTTKNPIHYLSATEILKKLQAQELGSRELLETCLARVQALNPALNAVVEQNLDAARARADEADRARARGESWGPLHGLPMTFKDTWELPGMRCTAGVPGYRDHRPAAAGPTVQRILDAGAIPFAKTNVPYKALDIQSYNPVYGTTNNPWDASRTCGGSSGGAAVALATGMTPLEIGSDLGGSIRLPAHFCGVYGHKSTYGITSMRGHIPEPGNVSEPALVVAGPMARSADDLQLLFDIVAGSTPALNPGWDIHLPRPRHARLDQYRVLVWVDDPDCPIDTDMAALYREMGTALKSAGAQVDVGAPLGLGLKDIFPLYITQMGGILSSVLTNAERRERGMIAPLGRMTPPLIEGLGRMVSLPFGMHNFLDGMTMKLGGWFDAVEQGCRLRETFTQVFERYDVILTPPTYAPAFRHIHSLLSTRKIDVNGKHRHYGDLLMWISPATLMGLPATSAPVGLTPGGLPVNVQIIGAPYHDNITIHFAKLMSEVIGGFRAPAGM